MEQECRQRQDPSTIVHIGVSGQLASHRSSQAAARRRTDAQLLAALDPGEAWLSSMDTHRDRRKLKPGLVRSSFEVGRILDPGVHERANRLVVERDARGL